MSQERPGLVYVVNSLNLGGTEKLVVEMAEAFSADYRVSVICLDEPGIWAERLRQQGISVSCVWREPGLDLRMPWRIAETARAANARILHAHQCTAWFYTSLARIFYRTPKLLMEEHGRFFPESDHRARRIVNRLFAVPLTHRFIAVSRDVKGRLARYEGVPEKHVDVVYNGVTDETPLDGVARRALRREWGFADDEFVVGTVGRFDPIKNLPMLVEAIHEAWSDNPKVRGFLIGDGPEMNGIRSLIEQKGLSDIIWLPGFREDARSLVQGMDLFVLASFSEGTSMALLEALRAGVPVAVTNVGGNPEIVQSGESGWVVESGAIDALAAIITHAGNDPEGARAMGEAGRRRFQAQFTSNAMIAQYRECYRQLLNGNQRTIDEQ